MFDFDWLASRHEISTEGAAIASLVREGTYGTKAVRVRRQLIMGREICEGKWSPWYENVRTRLHRTLAATQ
jgi:hypothetical protein